MNDKLTQKRILEFDGLRAIAILSVFLYHFDKSVFHFGWMGVDIFFAISGFVITIQCLTFAERYSAREAIVQFFIKRATRILPLYYLLLFGLFIAPYGLTALGVDPAQLSEKSDLVLGDTLWKNVLFLTNFYIFANGFDSVAYGITWSLAVEEHFYLLYPFVFFLGPPKYRVRIMIATAIAVLIFRLVLINFVELPGRTYFFTFTRLDALLVGCIAAYLYIRREKISGSGWLATFSVIVSVFLLANYKYSDMPMIVIGFTLIPLAVASLMYWIVTCQPPAMKTLLANRFMVFIGSISYGFYLLHVWVISGFEAIRFQARIEPVLGEAGAVITTFLIELALTILISHLSFSYFEKPSRAYLGRITAKLRQHHEP